MFSQGWLLLQLLLRPRSPLLECSSNLHHQPLPRQESTIPPRLLSQHWLVFECAAFLLQARMVTSLPPFKSRC